jgi:hypothetical protein
MILLSWFSFSGWYFYKAWMHPYGGTDIQNTNGKTPTVHVPGSYLYTKTKSKRFFGDDPHVRFNRILASLMLLSGALITFVFILLGGLRM